MSLRKKGSSRMPGIATKLEYIHKGAVSRQFMLANPGKVLAVVKQGVLVMEDNTKEGRSLVRKKMQELGVTSYALRSTISKAAKAALEVS